MARPPVQWRRIYRQTLTLIHKNFLIFYASPISTAIRALILPLIITLVLCYLKYLGSITSPSHDYGIADASTPLKDLAEAMNSVSKNKIVFVLNGTSNEDVGPIVDGLRKLPGMQNMDVSTIDDAKDLFDACKQSLQGESDCYAAVTFSIYNDTNVDYSIGIDSAVGDGNGWGNWQKGETVLSNRILPLQWAINAQIGGFSSSSKPSLWAFAGSFGPNVYPGQSNYGVSNDGGTSTVWLSLVAIFIGPIFFLILIGVVYHQATFVATERETSMAALMAAQEVTLVPRILSTNLSFFALYFPGFLFCSIIMTQVLFTKTSDILMILLTILAGGSLVATSHFVGSFFGRANLAGLYSSTLAFALALITLAATLTASDASVQNLALSLIFPPATWATLIEDIALRETNLKAFSLLKVIKDPNDPYTKVQYLDGYLYVIFFLVHIVAYSLGTYFVERRLWGVTRKYDRIDASSDVAVRCTGLTKTFHGKRRWYWPFSRVGNTVVAVNNLNLEVKKGSVTFLLGPNGGGKTTTLKCVAGMCSMDPGSQLELNEAGLLFGICPQNNVFWRGLTVEQHIKIWRKLKTAAIESTDADDDDVIAECDLLDKANAPAESLSGGQKRKLQLAISFVGSSKICCIDEASSGLDPLSRRNIWNIIQKGHSRRTILVTTHFLDEADVLADHIAIVYKGSLVCEGPSTVLKARFGDDYLIRSNGDLDDDAMVWRTANSAEATRKILELEALDNDNTYDVTFPTLEQVFLKVTQDTAIHAHGGDGFVGEQETADVIDEKIFALESEAAEDINLDVGHGIGLARQVQALFMKRYILLQQKAGWISYGISLIIPIIIAGALVKFFYDFKDLQTCQMNSDYLRNPQPETSYNYDPQYPVFESTYTVGLYPYPDQATALLGPPSAWSGDVQNALYYETVAPLIIAGASASNYEYVDGVYTPIPANQSTIDEAIRISRQYLPSIEAITAQITNFSGYSYSGFGIFAPEPTEATLFYSSDESFYQMSKYPQVFNLLTNRIVNASTTNAANTKELSTNIRRMRRPSSTVDFRSLPFSALIVLAFICASSIPIIYPVYEKINNVRALHYCNGVSPAALWFGYLLFDTQLIIIQSIFVWGLLFAGPLSRLYYASEYLLGIFILFGIATYLGTYVLSLYVKKAAFAIAAGVHVLLFVLYLVGYIVNEAAGVPGSIFTTYNILQYAFGLSSPSANLARGLWIATNSFEILCGKFADNDVSNPGSYDRYGSPYVNLLIQIIFLVAVLAIHEYGSADWFRRNVTHRGVPARLHYIVESGDTTVPQVAETEKNTRAAVSNSSEVLNVSRVSKFFGKNFAVENVSFKISTNETLALLGGNGAGKTTVINMIRAELIPNFGDIFLEGASVLRNPQKARSQMGVCPQDDAIDNLTVRQTLRFYATVKGLKDVNGNVTKVLNALNITAFEDFTVQALSGGTRRKLSVAIALLGNPRILLLDEPSTGQDAGAKRILWKALQEISANRAILLTTHSMEEAEALATNVAIMGTKMLATGTLTSLQESYGGAYSIRAVRDQSASDVDTEQIIKAKFEGMASNYFDSHGQISFNLPHDKKALGSIMRVMEGLKGEEVNEEHDEEHQQKESNRAGGSSAAMAETQASKTKVLTDYVINGPTLEEVFMNVARESGVTGVV